jgi:hypothetical protein
MLEIAGAENVGDQVDGVKPITAEAMVAFATRSTDLFPKRCSFDRRALKSWTNFQVSLSLRRANKGAL